MTSPQHSKISNEEPVGTFGVDASNNSAGGSAETSAYHPDSHVTGQIGLANWSHLENHHVHAYLTASEVAAAEWKQDYLDATPSDLSQGLCAEPCRYDYVPWSQTAITVDPPTGPSFSQDLNLSWPQTDLATNILFNQTDSHFDHVFDQEPLQLSTLAMQGYDSARAPTAVAFDIVPDVVSTTSEDDLIAPALTRVQEGVRPFGRYVIDHGLAPTQRAQSATTLNSSSTSTPTQGRNPNNTNTHSNAAQAIHCPHGCPKPLHRAGDYRRHMRKHQKPRYKCPDFDCDKTFYRADKMRDHIRQGHKGLKL